MNFAPPPKEIFSRQWYDESGFGMTMLRDDLYPRMDALCKKLTDLELALRRIHHTGGDSIFMAREKVWWVERAIGVYRVDNVGRAEKVYPKTYVHSVATKWNDLILGKEKKFGVVLVMLSPQCVEWLNTLSDWVSE